MDAATHAKNHAASMMTNALAAVIDAAEQLTEAVKLVNDAECQMNIVCNHAWRNGKMISGSKEKIESILFDEDKHVTIYSNKLVEQQLCVFVDNEGHNKNLSIMAVAINVMVANRKDLDSTVVQFSDVAKGYTAQMEVQMM